MAGSATGAGDEALAFVRDEFNSLDALDLVLLKGEPGGAFVQVMEGLEVLARLPETATALTVQQFEPEPLSLGLAVKSIVARLLPQRETIWATANAGTLATTTTMAHISVRTGPA